MSTTENEVRGDQIRMPKQITVRMTRTEWLAVINAVEEHIDYLHEYKDRSENEGYDAAIDRLTEVSQSLSTQVGLA